MKIVNPEDVKVGHWYTGCCHRDLVQILTQADLEEVIDIITDGDGETVDIWDSQIEALQQIRQWMVNSSQESDVAEIDMMLKELQGNNA